LRRRGVDAALDAEALQQVLETEAGADDAVDPTIEDSSAKISSPAVASQ
jgi:hypothetical protein